MTDDHRAEVRLLLAANGLPASDDEVAILAAEYAATRAGVDRMYDVVQTRYGEPALRFDPAIDADENFGPIIDRGTNRT